MSSIAPKSMLRLSAYWIPGGETSVLLDSALKGVLIGPGVWRVMRNFSSDCVLLVLADQHYDEADYIRDYEEFKKWVNQ